MNYHVRDVGPLEADLLLDLACARVCIVEAARPVEAEGQERDQTRVGAQEPEPPRLPAGRVADNAGHDRRAVRRHLAALTRLRQRLDVGLDTGDLRDGA